VKRKKQIYFQKEEKEGQDGRTNRDRRSVGQIELKQSAALAQSIYTGKSQGRSKSPTRSANHCVARIAAREGQGRALAVMQESGGTQAKKQFRNYPLSPVRKRVRGKVLKLKKRLNSTGPPAVWHVVKRRVCRDKSIGGNHKYLLHLGKGEKHRYLWVKRRGV